MKFCKRCRKRVIKEVSLVKDFLSICRCFNDYDYIRVGGPDVVRLFEGLATQCNRNKKKKLLPKRISLES